MKDEPTIGSPPMPTIVELPSPICVSSWPIWYVSVPERETRPMLPGREDLGGDDPDVRLARGERAGAVRAEHPDAARAHVRVDPQHVVGGDALGDRDHRLDAGVDGLVDGVGGERRGHEDHRRVGAVLADRLRRPCRARARPRRPARPCPASRPRRASCRRRGSGGRGTGPRTRSGPGRRAASRRRRRSPSGGPRQDRELVERQPAVGDPIAEQPLRRLGLLALAARAREPGGEVERVLEVAGRRRSRGRPPRRTPRHSASV